MTKKETQELFRSLGMTGRFGDLPLDVRRIAVLISELRERVATLEKKRK